MFQVPPMQLSRDKTTLSQFWGSTPPPRNPLQMSKKSKLSGATRAGSAHLANCWGIQHLRNILCSRAFPGARKFEKTGVSQQLKIGASFCNIFTEQHFPITFPPSPPSCLAQKHHSSFAVGKGVSTVWYGGRGGRRGEGRGGGWVDFVPRKVLPQALLAEGSSVDKHIFLSIFPTHIMLMLRI